MSRFKSTSLELAVTLSTRNSVTMDLPVVMLLMVVSIQSAGDWPIGSNWPYTNRLLPVGSTLDLHSFLLLMMLYYASSMTFADMSTPPISNSCFEGF